MYNPTSQPSFYVVDPQRDGFAGIWATISGSPAVVSNQFNFNAGEGLIRNDILGAHVEFNMVVPAVPTSGDVRQWGLKNISLGNRSKIFFDITGIAFTVNTYDDNGLVTLSTSVTWQAAWTNVAVVFTIDWFEDRVVFSATVVSTGAKIILATHTVDGSTPPKKVVGFQPLNPFIKNGNSDNLNSNYIIVKARNSSLILT